MVPKNIIVKQNSWLARLACRWMKSNAVALVWGHTIHLYGTDPYTLLNNPGWLAHELVHIRQYEHLGLTGFLGAYLWEWIKHGYHNNRYEREARDTKLHQDLETIFENYNFEIK